MFDVPYEKMVCDSDLGDGGLYFYNEYMEWVLRNSNSGFKIYYKDIQDVKIIYTRKKVVTIYMNNGSHRNLYLYKADTLKQLIHEAVDRVNGVVDNQEVPQEQPKEDNVDDLTKLERLAKLHESGALNDEEFAQAKKKILG
jgi:hypothetical protein